MNSIEHKALQRQLHRVIELRCREFQISVPHALPNLPLRLPTANDKAWFPVKGMYGGFSYWRDTSQPEAALTVESWCRVVAGSGQRHVLLPSGYELLEDSID